MTEARIRTAGINQVHKGQEAGIRLAAFRARATQLVQDRMIHVPADRLVERATDVAYQPRW